MATPTRPRNLRGDVKLCMLGEMNVGKTSLVTRLIEDCFDENYTTTLGATFLKKTIFHNRQVFRYNIWDTAGQERFRALTNKYYRDAHVVMIVYDITDPETYRKVESWFQEVEIRQPDIIYVLAGNKCDLEDERKVPREAGELYADAKGALFFECSAKTSSNVHLIFEKICELLLEKRSEEYGATDDRITDLDHSIRKHRDNNCFC